MSLLENPSFLALVEFVIAVPAFPLLWVPHCILTSLNLRATLGADWKVFSRRHPLSCYILAVLYTFPGAVVSNLLLGEPILSFFANSTFVFAMTAAWYLVFYAPLDAFVTLVDTLRLRVPLTAMQDFLRIQLVLAGVKDVYKTHPDAALYAFVFAAVKSSAFNVLKYIEGAVLSGSIKGRSFAVSHHSTKTCIVASAVFTGQMMGFLSVGMDAVFTLFVVFIVTLRLTTAVVDFDPHQPFESLFCTVVFGDDDNSNSEVIKVPKAKSTSTSKHNAKVQCLKE
jgi:hypothetical protein